MKFFTVNHPRECPWRMSTCCTHKNGGYALTHINCGPFVEDFPKECPMCNTDIDHITSIFEVSKEEEIKELSRLLYVAKQDCKQKNWEKLSLLLKGIGQKFGKLFK